MGGHAFPPQTGSRMTTEQLMKLEQHCRQKLIQAGIFDRVQMFSFTANKLTHGDLDLVVGCPDARGPPYLRGAERMDMDKLPPANVLATNDHLTQYKTSKGMTDAQRELNRMNNVRATAIALTRAIGGNAYKRNGNVVSVRVPCAVVCEGFGHDDFFQVDHILTAPQEFDFNIFVTSYSCTIVILAYAIRRLSQSLTLHNNNLTIKHSPFDGQPAIELVLTQDPKVFSDWLGLEYAAWKAQAFSSPTDLFEWLSDVPEDSLIAMSWRSMARRQHKTRYLAHIKKVSELDLYYAFLRESKWAMAFKTVDDATSANPDGSVLTRTGTDGIVAQVAKLDIAEDAATSPNTSDNSSPASTATPVATIATPTAPASRAMYGDLPVLTPAEIAVAVPNLRPLDASAQAALDHFGKRAEWDAALAQLTTDATRIWRSRLTTALNKHRLAEMKARVLSRASPFPDDSSDSAPDAVGGSTDKTEVAAMASVQSNVEPAAVSAQGNKKKGGRVAWSCVVA